MLHEGAVATPAITDEGEAKRVLIQMSTPPRLDITPKGTLTKVTPVSFGPWYKAGAPFRAKLSLPGEPGVTFVLTGRVWAVDTRRP